MKRINNKKVKKKSGYGFKDWAEKSVNCCTGCSNDCRYCYARSMAVRFKQLTVDEWPLERVRPKDVSKKHKKYDGRVMFPSSHDITPSNFEACFTVLEKLLQAGNEVLVVSKPHLECIVTICDKLANYADKFLFRFTIGSCDDDILSFWEPNASCYDERKAALMYAHDYDYQTSISIEPMLDPDNIEDLVTDLLPFVNESMWIGKMNHITRLTKILNGRDQRAFDKIMAGQTDEKIKGIYQQFKCNPMIKWKSCIKKVVGLPLPTKPGMNR